MTPALAARHHAWPSAAVGETLHVRWYGHGGARLLAFPTTMGDHREWPAHGIPEALREHIAKGWVTLFCLDQPRQPSWYDRRVPVGERARRHLAYDAYLRDELLPFTRQVNPTPFVIAAGASYGAYLAVTFALRNPALVQRVIGMSGGYDIRRLTDGESDGSVYLANPAEFVAREWQRDRLEAMQRMDIILAIGEDDPAADDTRAFSGLLWRKGIGNALRLWSGFAHDWPWWERMLLRYLGGHD